MEFISRKEAIAQGLKVYYTGVPCANSHISPRRVSNYGCLECERMNAAAFIARQPEYFHAYRLLHLEDLKSYDQSYYRKRKERPDA